MENVTQEKILEIFKNEQFSKEEDIKAGVSAEGAKYDVITFSTSNIYEQKNGIANKIHNLLVVECFGSDYKYYVLKNHNGYAKSYIDNIFSNDPIATNAFQEFFASFSKEQDGYLGNDFRVYSRLNRLLIRKSEIGKNIKTVVNKYTVRLVSPYKTFGRNASGTCSLRSFLKDFPTDDITKKISKRKEKEINAVKNDEILLMFKNRKDLGVSIPEWSSGNRHQLYNDNNYEYNDYIQERVTDVIKNYAKIHVPVGLLYIRKDFLIEHITDIHVNKRSLSYGVVIDIQIPYHQLSDGSFEYYEESFYSSTCDDFIARLEEIESLIPADDPERSGKILYLKMLSI